MNFGANLFAYSVLVFSKGFFSKSISLLFILLYKIKFSKELFKIDESIAEIFI